MVDRRDLDAAHRTDSFFLQRAGVVLLQNTGDGADEGARLLFLEEQADDVRVLQVVALRVGSKAIDDREVNVGELAGDGSNRLGHQEADANHQVVLLGCVVRQVGDVIAVCVRFGYVALGAKLSLAGQARADVAGGCRLGEPDGGQVVEALVVEAAGVGDQPYLDRLLLGTTAASGSTAGRNRDGQRQAHAKAEQTDGWLPHRSLPSEVGDSSGPLDSGRIVAPKYSKSFRFVDGGRSSDAADQRLPAASARAASRVRIAGVIDALPEGLNATAPSAMPSWRSPAAQWPSMPSSTSSITMRPMSFRVLPRRQRAPDG